MQETKTKSSVNTEPNLGQYEQIYRSFSWEKELNELDKEYKEKGLNIAYEAIDKHCEGQLNDHTAIRWIGKDGTEINLTYGNMKESTSKFANVLDKLSINKGDAVFNLTGRIPELYVAALGSLKYNAVFCPLFSVFGPEPIFQRMSSGDAKVLVTTKELYEKKIVPLLDRLPDLKFILLTDTEDHLDQKVLSYKLLMKEASAEFEIPYTDPETPALMHFTSGTTGMPKGALHVHKAVLVHYVTGKYVLDFHPGDVFWCTADPGWVTGTSYGIIAPLLHGITNIVDEAEFDVKRWYSLLQDEKVNIWYTAPTAIRRLMRTDIRPLAMYDLENLRLVLSVGEPLNPEAVTWGQEAFGVPVLDNWWQTETGGIMISNYRSMPVRPGSMGKPLPGIEAAVAEVTDDSFRLIDKAGENGHLVLKKGWPSMFRAYLHREEKYNNSFRGDWYLTGDLASIDKDGYFWFVGRADDIIKTSGHKVGPFEVESALLEHPDVAEAAVIGIPNEVAGEIVKAFVVLQSDSKPSDDLKLDIMASVRKNLGPVIAPREIEFTDKLPKTRSGKILRRLLKARELGLPEGDTSTLED